MGNDEPFCEAAEEKIANAFRHLMAHLRDVDPDHTVIAIQVENAIGLHCNCPGGVASSALLAAHPFQIYHK